jgi:hypothetical protein
MKESLPIVPHLTRALCWRVKSLTLIPSLDKMGVRGGAAR